MVGNQEVLWQSSFQ